LSVILLLAGAALVMVVVAPVLFEPAGRRPAGPSTSAAGDWLATSAVLGHDRALGLLDAEGYREARAELAAAHRTVRLRPATGTPWRTLLPLAAGVAAIVVSLLISQAVVPRPAGSAATGSLGLSAPAAPAAMQSPGTLLTTAAVLVNQGRLNEAQSLYEQVLAQDPRNVNALTSLGFVRYQLHDPGAALADAQQALRARPDYPPALLVEGLGLYVARHDTLGALAAWQRFLDVDPNASTAPLVRRWMDEARAGQPLS
jgi:tetratricopeptide (TPR) repeat protein